MGKSLEYDYVNGKSIHGNVLKITNHNRNANLKYNEITSHIYQLYLKQQQKTWAGDRTQSVECLPHMQSSWVQSLTPHKTVQYSSEYL